MGNIEKKAFIIGHPVAHSRSPKIHNHWLKTSNLSGSYEAIDVAPQNLTDFIADLQKNGFCGGNVTIPHKEAIFELVAHRDEAAELIGAANTLWFEKGRLWGGNTDAHGFAANLDEHAPGWADNGAAIVLGAGGAARAIIHALKERGVRDIRIVNRTFKRAQELRDRFGGGISDRISAHRLEEVGDLLPDAGLLVNTTALGMAGNEGLPADPMLLPDTAIVTDIVYVPLETPLLATSRQRGLRCVDGLGMLLHQAVPGFEHWFGIRPKVTSELRRLILNDLGVAT